jgi:hypothetical protein
MPRGGSASERPTPKSCPFTTLRRRVEPAGSAGRDVLRLDAIETASRAGVPERGEAWRSSPRIGADIGCVVPPLRSGGGGPPHAVEGASAPCPLHRPRRFPCPVATRGGRTRRPCLVDPHHQADAIAIGQRWACRRGHLRARRVVLRQSRLGLQLSTASRTTPPS